LDCRSWFQYGPLDFSDEIVVATTNISVELDAGTVADSREARPIQSVAEHTNGSANGSVNGSGNGFESVAEPIEINPADEALQAWRSELQEQVLTKMDLRRKDLHSMSDEAVKADTEQVLDEILHRRRDEIPHEIDLVLLKKLVLDDAVGLGPIEDLLRDDEITEIMVNRFDEIYVERAGQLKLCPINFSSDNAVRGVIERIISPLGRRIDESSPMVDARLADGSRVNAVIPPLALKGSCITIRKFSKKKLHAQDLINYGSIDEDMATFLKYAVENKRNVIVSGGTGSGKTTLLNVLSNYIPDSDRILTIEDAAELKLSQPDLVALEARPANVEGKGAVPIRDLVKNALRMRGYGLAA